MSVNTRSECVHREVLLCDSVDDVYRVMMMKMMMMRRSMMILCTTVHVNRGALYSCCCLFVCMRVCREGKQRDKKEVEFYFQ